MDKTDKLLKVLRSLEYSDAKNHLIAHINSLAEQLIENSWKRSRNLLRFARMNKKNQMSKFVLEMDSDTAAITMIDFTKYVACLQDALETGVRIHTNVEDFADELEGIMYTKLANIKIDRRTIFSKD